MSECPSDSLIATDHTPITTLRVGTSRSGITDDVCYLLDGTAHVRVACRAGNGHDAVHVDRAPEEVVVANLGQGAVAVLEGCQSGSWPNGTRRLAL